MMRAVSRLVVRVAIIAATLAWAGFVFTNTVGDPGRGPRIAEAVLADADARAEVVAPIAAAVARTAGLPATQQPAVAIEVDALLQDPATARTFVEPFAGQWARMLGTDGLRPEGYDVDPLVDEIMAHSPGLGGGIPVTGGDQSAVTGRIADPALVPGVQLPQLRLGWLIPDRETVMRSTDVLALLAAAGFAAGLAIGDRRWVLRRIGAWATFAGSTWVIAPLVVVWMAQRWASGADAVVAVVVREAVSGLRPTALILLIGGVVAFTASFGPAPRWLMSPAAPRQLDEQVAAAQPSRHPIGVVDPPFVASTPAAVAARRSAGTPVGGRRWPNIGVTAVIPRVDRRPKAAPVVNTDGHDGCRQGDDHHDPLWNYYS